MFQHLQKFFLNPRSLSTGVAFFIMGFLFGNWATLIPYIKNFYQIDDATLGLILLCLPLGAMTFNPLSAVLIQKYGSTKMCVIGSFLLTSAYMIPLSVSSLTLLSVGMFLVGISITILNISANSIASLIEKHENIHIMSTCHGMFSVGLMSGSLMRSFTLVLGVNEMFHMLLMCGVSFGLIFLTQNKILGIQYGSTKTETHSESRKVRLIIPKGVLLTIIFISVCVNVTEGMMADWASLYMKEIVKTNPIFVGWGLFGYSAMMATGRLFGDGIIPVIGRNKVLMYGASLAVLGLTISIILPYTWSVIIGFGMVGLGVSCGSPILYASAGRYPDLPDSGGLAIMNTYAMGGFLLGPVVIGFISKMASLPVAFGCVAGLGLWWYLLSSKVKLY